MSEQNQTPPESQSGGHAFFEIDTEAWKNMSQRERLQYTGALREHMIGQWFEDFVDESEDSTEDKVAE
jgi:hypothetical protein